jgi:hypothetical protein
MEHDDVAKHGAPGSPPPKLREADGASEERLKFLWEVLKYMDRYSASADSRATTTLVVASSLIGALYQTKVHQAFTSATWEHWFRPETLAAVAAFICLVLGIYFCILVVIPRLKKTAAAGFVYWESVRQHGTQDEFWRKFASRSQTDMAEHLAQNVFVLAHITTRKYALLRRGMLSAFIGGILGATVLIFR